MRESDDGDQYTENRAQTSDLTHPDQAVGTQDHWLFALHRDARYRAWVICQSLCIRITYLNYDIHIYNTTSRSMYGKRERPSPRGASLWIARSAVQYRLPPARWGRHRHGGAGARRSPPRCPGSWPLTGPDARPPGCAQRLLGHAVPPPTQRLHGARSSLWRRRRRPTPGPN